MAKSPFIETANNQEWENWHKSIHVGGEVNKYLTPYNLYTDHSTGPTSQEFLPGLEGLQQIIADAKKDNATVRGHGSKWSLNNVAFTSAYLVDSRKLDYYKIGIDEVTEAYKDKKECLSFVQCGVLVKQLNQGLTAKGQALITSGASDGQTLIGAISTGTHGGANRVGAMTEFVRGIHLVIQDNHVFVQRKSDQAVTPAFGEWLGKADFLLDDDLFNAALVGFGGFGLIHGLLIETEPQYNLERIIKNLDYSEVKHAITTLNMAGLDLPDGDKTPFHFEVVLNPYFLEDGKKGAFLRVYYKRPIIEDGMPLTPLQHEGEHHDIHSAMAEGFSEEKGKEMEDSDKNIGEVDDGEIDEKRVKEMGIAVQIGLAISFKVTKEQDMPDIKIPANFFTGKNSTKSTSSTSVPATSLEIGVPFERIGDAVDLIVKTTHRHPFAAPLALRYVKKSTATIGFTGLGDITVTMEMPGPYGKLLFWRTGKGHKAIFEALADSDIPHSYHWGQQLPENDKWPKKTYGARLTEWKNQRKKLLGDSGIKMFSNPFIDSFLDQPKPPRNFFIAAIMKIAKWFTGRLGA